MKQFEVETALHKRAFPKAFMLFGESHFLIDYYIKAIAEQFSQDDEPLALYHSEYHFSTAKAHLSQGSLFGGNNVLIIKNEKKVPKKELDELIALTIKQPGAYFIYGYYGPDHKPANGSGTAFKKTKDKDSVRLFTPFQKHAIPMLTAKAKALNIRIDNYTLIHLFNSQNGDIALSMNELNKFAIFDRPITTQDVNDLVYSLAEVKLDQVINDLLYKKAFIPNLEKLLEAGEDPIKILTAISNHVQILFLFVANMKLYATGDSKQVLGYKLPPHIENERTALAKRFKLSTYKEILTHLCETELVLKSPNSGSKEAVFFAALLKLQKLL